MLNAKSFADLQKSRNTSSAYAGTVETDERSFIEECRRYIRDNSSAGASKEQVEGLLDRFLAKSEKIIPGYCTEDQKPDTSKLRNLLYESIFKYDILTVPIEDEKVYEIRCNGREIKIEKEGRIVDLTDKDGNIVTFKSREQQEAIIRKLLGDERLTPKYALANARTKDGFRIAAVHHTAISPDPDAPTEDVFNAFVLRKFRKSKLTLNDLVKYKTLSDNMAKFLSIQSVGGATFFTVGPTASGKTTLNNAILQEIPIDTRVVLLQNPSEIDIRKKDANGRVINDVIHLEAKEFEDPTVYDATMANLMNHTLRFSPTFVVFGELRSDIEFMLGTKIMKAGHPVNGTYHADDSMGAVERYVEARVNMSGNIPPYMAVQSFVNSVNLIIVQRILRDGTRKVMEITEVLGVDPQNPNLPNLNMLYKFKTTGRAEYHQDGRVAKIPGVHIRVGTLSNRTIDKFEIAGVPPEMYEFLCKPVQSDTNGKIIPEVETYLGNNVLGLGGYIK